MFKTRLFILTIIAAVALSACATLPQTLSPTQPATATPPRATPAQPGAPVTTLPPIITPLPADGDVMPRFILAARQALAARLNLNFDQVVVVSIKAVDWPNACLGLPEANEMCAQVITPGYRVMLRVNNQEYEVRTGSSTSVVRIAPQAPAGQTTSPAEKARADLAQRLRVTAESITILEVEEKDWPDSCLGISQKDVQCLQVITPGFQVNLEHKGRLYIYHTNRTGSTVMLAESQGAGIEVPGEALLTWKSPGSNCQAAVMSLTTISFGPCNTLRLTQRWENVEHLADLKHFVETFAPFSAETKAGSLQFKGSGASLATPAEQRAIAEWAEMASASASGGKGGASYGLALSWHREGGIAGFCDDLLIYRSGAALASSCKGNSARKLGAAYLTSAQLDQLYAWLDDLKTFSYKYSDPATADAMRLQLLLNGTGNREVTDSIRQAMLNLSQEVFSSISQLK